MLLLNYASKELKYNCIAKVTGSSKQKHFFKERDSKLAHENVCKLY